VIAGISNPAASGTNNPGETLVNITTAAVQVSYTYALNTPNGCVNSQIVTVSINPSPLLSSSLAPAAICSGSVFSYTPTSNSAGAIYSWNRSVVTSISNGPGSGSGLINPSEVLVNTSINQVTVPYNYIITANGCSNTQTVNVVVNPTPNVTNQVTTICGNTAFAINPINVPAGTQYTWSVPVINPLGSVNGGSAQGVLQSTIGQTLTNQTLSSGIATYTVTPDFNGCAGVSFSVAVTVKPTAAIANQILAAVCSGAAFNYASTTVPPSTTYTWSSPVLSPLSSLTGGSGQAFSQSSISQVLSSTNNLTNTATYTVIPSTAGCVGNNNMVDTICSGGTFTIVPAPVPANTTYTWTAPTTVPFGSIVGGKAQTLPASIISQSLLITGNSISQAVYTITPNALGCAGTPFTLIETVGAPLAAVANKTALICSGTSFDLTPTTTPPNTTYTWAAPTVAPPGSVTGYSAKTTRQTQISQTLTNLISTTATVVYTVVPFNTGCTGSPFTATVNVSPVPKATITGKPVVCRDPFDTLSVSFAGTAPWSFSYLDNNVPNTVTGITASPYTWILPSLPAVPVRTFQITLVNDRACVDSVDTAVFVQKINPLPIGQIISLHGIYICNNTPDTLFVSYPITDTLQYQWTRNGFIIPGATVDSISTVSGGKYNAVLTNQYGCVDTASPPVTLIYIAQPKLNFTYDSYCINNLIHFTNLTDTTFIGQTQWLWDLGDSTTANTFHSVDMYPRAGNRHIRLTATQLYCQSYNTSLDSTINIEFPLPAIRMPSVSAYKGQLTPVAVRNIPGYKYLWTPTRGIDFPDRPSANFNYQVTQDYFVNLTSPAGCITTDSVLVRVFDDKLVDILVPKSFTPNGDGVNDILYPYLAGIKTFQYFKVYNRFGKLLFETTNPDAGWNGSLNGTPQPMAIYIWVATGIALDGTPVQKTGETLLLR
jgi:gliding motility-associated-like protein